MVESISISLTCPITRSLESDKLTSETFSSNNGVYNLPVPLGNSFANDIGVVISPLPRPPSNTLGTVEIPPIVNEVNALSILVTLLKVSDVIPDLDI